MAQSAERIFKKVAKTFNKTYTGLKNKLQRFKNKFPQNPNCKDVKSNSKK